MQKKEKITQYNGRAYNIDQKKFTLVSSILDHASFCFKQPCLFHFSSQIINPDEFSPKRFTQNFKRSVHAEYRNYFKFRLKKKGSAIQNALGCPNHLIYYSIEYKAETKPRTTGDYESYQSVPKQDYLHIHIHVVVDCFTGYIPQCFSGFVLKALGRINGLDNNQYHKRQNKSLYHNLNKELEDAKSRAKYLCKVEQKSSKIPFKKTFGYSRLPTIITN